MIASTQLSEIGRFNKPHGIKGELSAGIFDDIGDPEALPCIFVEIDGLFVPFFIEGVRPKGSESYLLTIKGINDEKAAALLANKTIYAETSRLPESAGESAEGFYVADLVGFTIVDGTETIGEIIGFDDSTENILLSVERPDGSTALVPVADEFIDDIDTTSGTITMNLPEGLLSL